jgi:sortase A
MSNKKRSLISVIGTLFIIGGIILILYPPFTSFYSRWKQSNLEKEIATQEIELSPFVVKGLESGDSPAPEEQKEPVGLFVLKIPAIKLSVGVVEGTGPGQLRIGPGWYPQSALPGKGNTAIAGHLNIYGSWFRQLNRLKRGDEISLTYKGTEYLYTVERVFELASNDWSIIEPCGYNALTLTTCDPGGNREKRFAVRAKQKNKQE